MGENLKGPVQVRGPSYSMCRKIIWEVDFHNYMFLHTNHSDFWGPFCTCAFILKSGTKTVMSREGVALETDI